MTGRTATLLAWWLCGLSIGMLVAGGLLDLSTGIDSSELVFIILTPLFVLAFGAVGALVASRQRSNPIGWIFVGVAVLWSLSTLCTGITDYSAAHHLAGSPLVRFTDWFGSWVFLPAIYVPVTFLFLLFPEGRLLSPRWRPIVWISIVGVAGLTASSALAPGRLEDTIVLRSNPFAVGSASLWNLVGGITWPLVLGGMLASIGALVVRFRRSSGEERRQVRTLLWAGIFVIVIFAASTIGFGLAGQDQVAISLFEASITFGLLLVPVAAGIAILKYRLYEIDLVIRKAVIVGALVVFVTLIYIAVVVGIGRAVGAAGASRVLSLAATAIVAVLFQPARERAQRLADRLVFGKRATPYEVLAEFGGKVSTTFATDDVLDRMATVLAEGTGADSATVWLHVGGSMRPVATAPVGAPSPVDLAGDAVEVVDRGEVLGALSVRMPSSDPMNPAKRKLIEDLASQAGLVLRNVRLIEELRGSRRRIVTAQDERAKKLERDIHDGAQQQLIALAVKERLAASLIGKDDDRLRAMLEELQRETTDALEELRDLARGIYPPLLADKGLGEAIEAQARKSAVPITVECDAIGRYSQEVESAVYFSVLEALQNIAKYADAPSAKVLLAQANGHITFEIADEGRGFDRTTAVRGTGLQGMADRLEAIGGELTIDSAPGHGTQVIGRIPVEEPRSIGAGR